MAPSTRDLTVAVLNGVTVPIPVRYRFRSPRVAVTADTGTIGRTILLAAVASVARRWAYHAYPITSRIKAATSQVRQSEASPVRTREAVSAAEYFTLVGSEAGTPVVISSN